MNAKTKANLIGLVDTFGRPLLQADVNGVPFNTIFGKTIVISTFADNATAGLEPLLFGDLEGKLHSAHHLQRIEDCPIE